jgi:hypothetical protein
MKSSGASPRAADLALQAGIEADLADSLGRCASGWRPGQPARAVRWTTQITALHNRDTSMTRLGFALEAARGDL